MENIKQKVLQLVGDFNSDSKKKSSEAEYELIEICEPIIKKFKNVCREFGQSDGHHFGDEYRPSSGCIEHFEGIENTDELVFYYNDFFCGEEHPAYLRMPLHWLDEDGYENYRKYIKGKKLTKLEYELENYQKQVERVKKEIEQIEARQ